MTFDFSTDRLVFCRRPLKNQQVQFVSQDNLKKRLSGVGGGGGLQCFRLVGRRVFVRLEKGVPRTIE